MALRLTLSVNEDVEFILCFVGTELVEGDNSCGHGKKRVKYGGGVSRYVGSMEWGRAKRWDDKRGILLKYPVLFPT